MTLETCRIRLGLAKTDEDKAFWEAKIARRLLLPKYAKEVQVIGEKSPKPKASKGKKNG